MDQFLLEFFQSIRNPFFTALFGFFSFLGEGAVLVVAVLAVYWLTKPRTGERIAMVAMSSLAFNVAIKSLVGRPRPYVAGVVDRLDVDTPFVSTVDLEPNVSFPSGHAQSTSSFLSAVSLRTKRGWVRIGAALVVLLVMCSRLYFGVHYPSDVLTGLAFGIAVALFWEFVYEKIPGSRYYFLCAFAALSLVPVAMGYPNVAMTSGLLAGCACCLPFAERIARKNPPKGKKKFFRLLVGAALSAGVYFLSTLLPDGEAFTMISFFLLAAAATLLSQTVFKLLRI